jgi:hypothetical protein
MKTRQPLWRILRAKINQLPIGTSYKIKDLIADVYPDGNAPKVYGGKFYRIRSYHSMISILGFVSRDRRGKYTVVRHIPEWFTVSHAEFLRGWKQHDTPNLAVPTYKGLTASMIKAKLSHDHELEQANSRKTEVHKVKVEIPLPVDFHKESNLHNDLIANLKENVGLLHSALLIFDNIEIVDPLMQGRVINVFTQIKSIYESVNERIQADKIQPSELAKLLKA